MCESVCICESVYVYVFVKVCVHVFVCVRICENVYVYVQVTKGSALVHGGDNAQLGCWTFLCRGQCRTTQIFNSSAFLLYISMGVIVEILTLKRKGVGPQLFCTEDIKDGVVVLVEAKKLVVGVTMSAKVRMC